MAQTGREKRAKQYQLTLTGERIPELARCKTILGKAGLTGLELTPQRIISAAMQTMIQMDDQGVKTNTHWIEGRSPEL